MWKDHVLRVWSVCVKIFFYFNVILVFPIQLRIDAFDSSLPDIRSQTVLYVTVRRNENKPSFESTYTTVEINATWPQGQEIIVVTATDADATVSLSR